MPERLTGSTLFPGFLPLLAFFVILAVAVPSVDGRQALRMTAAPCPAGWCVATVFPAGPAWSSGIRPGDRVLRIDGADAAARGSRTVWSTVQSLVVETDDGRVLTAQVTDPPIRQNPLRWSLWTVAGFFAVLGSLVWYRRPDLKSAAAMGRMTGVAAVSLTIAPVAGGSYAEWALAVQFPALTILGFTFFDFTYQLANEHRPHPWPVVFLRRTIGGLTIAILAGYLASVTAWLGLYEAVRPMLAATLAAALLASVAVLLVAVIQAPGGSEENRLRVPLLGMVLGATPFPLATLVPLALGYEDPLAPYLTVLPVVLIPTTFAYSILHDQLWGIRRLIHRSLVYGLLSAALMAVILLGVLVAERVVGRGSPLTGGEVIALSVIVFVGVVLYSPILRTVHRALERVFYRATPSYPEFVRGLQRDLNVADPESELPETLSNVMAKHLDLESAVLLLHGTNGETAAAVAVGDGHQRVLSALEEKRLRLPEHPDGERPSVIPFEGEQVLSMQLWAANEHIGTILLGPKRGGELFINEEVTLVMNAAPFMAAALERHEMSQTMRQLNRRIVETDELSRQRMAVDLHDGPLQKAVALAMGRIADPSEQKEVATDLVTELREIGSRLRPSILDDLGLPASIEWLLEHNMRGTDIHGTLALEGVDVDDRFDPDVELALFRVTQEAINNAVKHSSASELCVSIERDQDRVALTIRDNGVGLGGADSGRIPSSRLGMVGMRERVMQVNGHLEVHSWPGRGVFIQAVVPTTPAGA